MKYKNILLHFLLIIFGVHFAGNNVIAFPNSLSALSVSKSNNDIALSWPAINTDHYDNLTTINYYNIYRATTLDVIPDYTNHTNLISQPNSNSYIDTNALLATDSYYYLVTVVDIDGTESLVPSNLGCKIRLDLTYNPTGTNKYWFVLPDNTSLSYASDIASLSSNISNVIRWDAALQGEEVWDASTSTGINFTINPGEAYAVVITADTVLNLVGSFNGNSFNLTKNPTAFNHHWLSLPQPLAANTASELAQEMNNVSKVGIYDTANDTFKSWFLLDGTWMGEDFPLTPGAGIVVSLADSINWTPSSGIPTSGVASVPDEGYESITVQLNGTATDTNGSIASWQWDFEGDGVFDSTDQNPSHTYTSPGTYYPTLLVIDDQGHRAAAYVTVTISSLNVNFSVPGFSPGSGESADIQYTLPEDGTVTIYIYNNNGDLIKSLLVDVAQTAGSQSVNWDGTDNSGQQVTDGTFYAVIQYTVGGHTSFYDTRTTSGGIDVTSTVTNVDISQTLSPLEGEYVNISYTLPENSLVTVIINDASGNAVRHLLSDSPRSAGSHTEIWDGVDDSGNILATGTTFNVEITATSIATNSLVVKGQGPELSNITAAPLRFRPVTNPYGLQNSSECRIDFDLNKQADVTANVYSQSGVLVRTMSYNGLASGSNQVVWNGFDNSGLRMSDGLYTIRLRAEDSNGTFSDIFTIQTEIFY